MTSPDHRTGTERVAEVARGIDAEIIANIQGDEPLIRGDIIDEAIRPLISDDSIHISTLRSSIFRVGDWSNPNVVKVVTDRLGFALYFSRSPIPFIYKHIGLYVFRRSLLLSIGQMAPTPLEEAEGLEQLRFLENGYRIKVIPVDYHPVGVDTPGDLEEVRERLAREDLS
jgi:3-deoxy-manno-octulosonate cytidylyltransferase (CMP-KDO synthetase)